MTTTTLPADGYIEDAARLEPEVKTYFDDIRQVHAELVGALAEVELTIATGSITPSQAVHSVDTEADSVSDDLSNILTTNMADGRVVVIRADNASRTVVVKNAAGGAGQIHTSTGTDITLDGTVNMVTLIRRGADWYELSQTNPMQWLTAQFNTLLQASSYVAVGGITGGGVSNGADADHDIDFAPQAVRDTTNVYTLALSSTLTKQIDAAWVAGTAAGGLFSGTVANNTDYYLYLIRKDSDGSIDAGFDTSSSAANIPAGYTAYQRVMGVRTGVPANILGFSMIGRHVFWKDPPLDVSAVNPGTLAVPRTLTVPPGVPVVALLNVTIDDASTSSPYVYLSPLSADDEAPSVTVAPLAQVGSSNSNIFLGNAAVPTNTSRQIRSRLMGSNASTDLYISTIGWIDPGVF